MVGPEEATIHFDQIRASGGEGAELGHWHVDLVGLGATDHAPDPTKPGEGRISGLSGHLGVSGGSAASMTSFANRQST